MSLPVEVVSYNGYQIYYYKEYQEDDEVVHNAIDGVVHNAIDRVVPTLSDRLVHNAIDRVEEYSDCDDEYGDFFTDYMNDTRFHVFKGSYNDYMSVSKKK